jgi:uncharacterized protein
MTPTATPDADLLSGRPGRTPARPLVTALVLEVLFAALLIGGARVLGVLMPRLPGYSLTGISQSLVLVAVTATALLTLIAAKGWWRTAALTPRSQWRGVHLYWLPVLLLLAPLVAGIRPPALTALGMLAIAYLLTAVFEEGLFRGVILGLLRPLGTWPAVLISSVLFGAMHLPNQLLRGFSVMILLQAFGAAVQGIGFAALRLRTNTIWPLIAIHALHDLALQLGHMPVAAVDAPIATATALYGIVLLRRRSTSHASAATPPDHHA